MAPRWVGDRSTWIAATLVLLLALWNNVLLPQVPGYPRTYVPANLAAAAALLTAARAAGLSWAELGLARRHVRAGLRWGAVCLALVAAGYAVALALPVVRPLLADARTSGLDGTELAYRTLVRVPLGTVLWEELAFRGVLLAVLARLVPVRRAVWVSAAVFGLWHVRPTMSALAVNDLGGGPLLTAVAVLAACLGTAVAGVVLAELRLRSGSLAAPALLHVATNSLGTLAAAAAHGTVR